MNDHVCCGCHQAEDTKQPTLQQAIEKVKELRDESLEVLQAADNDLDYWDWTGRVNALNAAIALLESLASTPPDGGWLDIESAPSLVVVQGFWMPDKGKPTTPECYGLCKKIAGEWESVDGESWAAPDYWQSLPSPPKEQQ